MKTANIVTISAALNNAVAELNTVGKTPWVIIVADNVTAVYSGRAEARANKPEGAKVAKAAETMFQVVTPATPKGDGKPKLDVLRKSLIESPCYVVWDTADKMKGARRKDVIAACVAKGIAFYTARTQYQLWLASSKA